MAANPKKEELLPPTSNVSSATTSKKSISDVSEVEGEKTLGNYVLGKTLGEGTFGKVRIAVHTPTGEKVAVKVLEKSKIKEPADIVRVKREIKILKKVRHHNVIQLYEVIDTKNAIYLVMENVPGGEMFDYIVAHKHVQEKQACKFFHQIVDGLEDIHRSEVTHRDLKPENLLLKPSPGGWMVKIVDFGLSNTHEGGRLLSTACGSPCYAAPEMIAGKKYQGPVVDIWSLGVILFALVSGYLPFEDPNTSALYKKILAGDYKPPKFISSDVKDLIRRILETDPRKRFSIDQIRQHSWYQQVSESSIPRETIPEDNKLQIHLACLETLVEAGISKESVMEALQTNVFNSVTSYYYLLEQKYRVKYIADKKKAEEMSSKAKEESVKPSGAASKGGNQQPVAPTKGKPSDKSDRTAKIAAKATAVNGIIGSGYEGVIEPTVAAERRPSIMVNDVAGAGVQTHLDRGDEQTQDKDKGAIAIIGAGTSRRPSIEAADGAVAPRRSSAEAAAAVVGQAASKRPSVEAVIGSGTLRRPSNGASQPPHLILKPIDGVGKENDAIFDDSVSDDGPNQETPRVAEPVRRPSDAPRRGSEASKESEARAKIIDKLFKIEPRALTNPRKLSEIRNQQINKLLYQKNQKLEKIEKRPHLVRDQLDAPQTLTVATNMSKEVAPVKAPTAILSLLKLKYPRFTGESTKVTLDMPAGMQQMVAKAMQSIPTALEQHPSMVTPPDKALPTKTPAPPEGRPVSRHARNRSIGKADLESAMRDVNIQGNGETPVEGGEAGSIRTKRGRVVVDPAAKVTTVQGTASREDAQAEEIRAEATVERQQPRRNVMASLLASIIS